MNSAIIASRFFSIIYLLFNSMMVVGTIHSYTRRGTPVSFPGDHRMGGLDAPGTKLLEAAFQQFSKLFYVSTWLLFIFFFFLIFNKKEERLAVEFDN